MTARRGGWHRGLALILAGLLVWHPLNHALADTQRSAGLQGQREGRVLVDNIALPTLENGQLRIPLGGETLMLTPGELLPGSAASDVSVLENAYGSDSFLEEQGDQARATLAADDSATGDAYRLLNSQRHNPRPGLEQDPLWALTDTVQADPNILSQVFADCGPHNRDDPRCVVSGLLPQAFSACATTRRVTPFTDYKHVPDYRICEQIQQLTRCDVTREVEVRPFEQRWTIRATGCVEDEVRSFRPSAATLISGSASFAPPGDPALSLLQLPTPENAWTTQVQLTGNAQYRLESQPRAVDPVTGDALACEPGWQPSADPEFCEREVMWCDAPTSIQGTLVFSGDLLAQPAKPPGRDCGRPIRQEPRAKIH